MYRVLAATALIAVAIAILSLMDTRPADACFVNYTALKDSPLYEPPASNMHMGPDCVWRFADGTTATESFPYMTLLRSALLVSALAITVTALVTLKAKKMGF